MALLVIGSGIFYGAWDYRFLALIMGVILISFLAQDRLAKLTEPRSRRFVLWSSVILLLSILGVFKYFNFFVGSFIAFGQTVGLDLKASTLSIILPVGISFYVFQAIGLIVDVSRRTISKRYNLLEVAFFVAFFPQLVAGPIVRAKDFFPQLELTHKFKDIPFKGVAILFLGGFFKKAVLADSIGMYLVDPVFADPSNYSRTAIIAAVLAYAAQIYCDFSGYSDMAIAVSRCFGYRLPINFAAPYLSLSITEFWKRWHISLSHWLRDYLYISLGGNRGTDLQTYRNLLMTMILGGLWHGASWNFLFWGYLHGSALAIERSLKWPQTVIKSRLLKVLGWGLTFYITCVCWVFFRSTNFDVSLYFVSVLFGGKAGGSETVSLGLILLLVGLFTVHALIFSKQLGKRFSKLPAPIVFSCLGLLLALMLPFIPREAQPFIYFQF